MKKKVINMEQFQMPTVYKYHLMIFGPESARRLHRAPFVYSARPYSNGELGQVLHAVQVAINDSADHSMDNINDLVERELHSAGFATKKPEIETQNNEFPARLSYTHEGDATLFSVIYDDGEENGSSAIGKYHMAFDQNGNMVEKTLCLDSGAQETLAHYGRTLEDIGVKE